MMARLALAGRGAFSIRWLESLPLREFLRWAAIIAEELEKMAAEISSD